VLRPAAAKGPIAACTAASGSEITDLGPFTAAMLTSFSGAFSDDPLRFLFARLDRYHQPGGRQALHERCSGGDEAAGVGQ
jgi:hypothetical protein